MGYNFFLSGGGANRLKLIRDGVEELEYCMGGEGMDDTIQYNEVG